VLRKIIRREGFDDCAIAVFGTLLAADDALRAAEWTLAREFDLTILPIVDVIGDVDVRALKLIGTPTIPACIVTFSFDAETVTLLTVVSADADRAQ
jgi:hypothetical protein